MEKHVRARCSPKTQRNYEGIIRHDLIPWFGSCDIREISKADIIAIRDAKVDQTQAGGREMFAVLSSLFSFAADRGIVEQSPCAGVKTPKTVPARERVLADGEIVLFWEATGSLAAPNRDAMRLLLVTGQRLKEVGQARWGEFDFEKAVWTIPSQRTKNGVTHDVALSPLAMDVLWAALRNSCGYGPAEPMPSSNYLAHLQKTRSLVFSYWGNKPINGWSKAKTQLDAAMGRLAEERQEPHPTHWTLHDLRRSAATGLAALNVPSEVTERVLSHRSGKQSGLVGVYQRHQYVQERREALVRWGNHLAALVGHADCDKGEAPGVDADAAAPRSTRF